MVNLDVKEYQNKTTGKMIKTYKVGMMNPLGLGLTIKDCIFGQFVFEPTIRQGQKLENGVVKHFEIANAVIIWFNLDPNNTNVQLNDYGNVQVNLPKGVIPILKAQEWKSRYFMIYLEQFTGPKGDARTRFKLLETDMNAVQLQIQPKPVYPVKEPMARPQMNNINVQIPQAPVQQNKPVIQSFNGVNIIPPKPSINNVQVPQVPVVNNIPRPVVPVAPTSLPPLPPQVPQAPVMQQQPIDKYARFNLSEQEKDVVETLLMDNRYKDWKESANRSQEYFNQAMIVVYGMKKLQQPDDHKLATLYECWNSL